MQSFSSRIWTRVAVSISYDDNHYVRSNTHGKLLKPPNYLDFELDNITVVLPEL